VFDPTSMIPIWNQSLGDYVESIFFFIEHFLSKKGGIILFYLNDLQMQKEIVSFVDAYEFTINLKWIVINSLPIINIKDKTHKVCCCHHLIHLFSLCIWFLLSFALTPQTLVSRSILLASISFHFFPPSLVVAS
jgi:hypothetical protein